MTLPPDYLDYPLRRRGMDHDLYRFRALPQAKPVRWPGGARVALWIAVHMGHFPMDLPMKPFTVLGAGERAYPSYWDYTQRDYGNRVGIYRILKALSARGLRATALMSGVLPERYPPLARDIADAGWEVAAGGLDMGRVHHGGVPEAEERARIARALAILRGAFGAEAIRAWHSPGFSESLRTLDLLGEAGLDWVADWGVNDDMPYALATASGRALTSMPLSYDLSDQRMIYQHNLATEDFTTAILAAHAALDAEAAATGAGRILCLAVTPWVMGQPHRIRALGALLDALAARGGLWPATGAEILDAWRARTGNED
jgi:peptidoglycan/xylan/chitin deacetylase (PgdA/CDA1 family)